MSDLTDQLQAITRQHAVISVTPDLIASLWHGRFEIVDNALPEDARTVGAYYDTHRHVFCVIVESKEFAPVSILDPLPEWPAAAIRRIDGEGVRG